MLISWIHAHVTFGNWGLAIIVLTIGLRLALFPLTWKQIQSTIQMRRLKPEIDVLNDKFKDDAQAKNLAMMELWRKNKVNPLGGCLPALVQMPIWFALYATLQTAIEFYHTQFLVVYRPLGARIKFYVLPLVLGRSDDRAAAHRPQQGMDPVQAENDDVPHAGVFHRDDAVSAGRARRLHADKQRARHHAAARGRKAVSGWRQAPGAKGIGLVSEQHETEQPAADASLDQRAAGQGARSTRRRSTRKRRRPSPSCECSRRKWR
jgi:YidC/Oxa1 family membrane protein insertase